MVFVDIIGWMPELDDRQLLAEFVGRNSEAAFTTLVERYVNLVYPAAKRTVKRTFVTGVYMNITDVRHTNPAAPVSIPMKA
ncbi:MAG TPA: hypothetical protein VED19_00865 [Candidatus Nitrosopolaris sp.]|nr:hypothetical protein [Candidatus Nitrosopolaris sp.]